MTKTLNSSFERTITTNATLHDTFSSNHTIIVVFGNEFILTYLWVITLLFNTIAAFGIGTNIVNILCFAKQGFTDPVNISLLGLAISDLGSLSSLIWTGICYTPAFMAADLPFDSLEYQYLTGSIPHTTFTRITAWITALITLERCLCITAPLKIKHLVTTKRLSVIIVCIFAILMGSVAPAYVVNTLGMKFYPERNKTLLGLVFTKDRETVEKWSFAINNTLIPFSAFIVIIVCTVTLAIKLKQKTQWRIKSTSSLQADTVSSRNQKVAKMVVIISTIFIACLVPISLLFLGMSMMPELSILGKSRNILILTGGVSFVLESINSSVNIFIYHRMSSKFREAFRQVMHIS